MTPVMTFLFLLSGSASVMIRLGVLMVGVCRYWLVVMLWFCVICLVCLLRLVLLPFPLRLQLEPKGERKLFIFLLRLSWLLLRALPCLVFLGERFRVDGEGEK